MTEFPQEHSRHLGTTPEVPIVPGEEILTHDSVITPEQALKVNEQFQVDIYGGRHGANVGTEEEPLYAEVTDTEYDEARMVVDSMKSGDVLFVEAVGHPEVPLRDPQKLGLTLGDFSLDLMISPAAKKQIAQQRQEATIKAVERSKDERRLSPWEYAAKIAEARGNRVVLTDLNARESQQIEAATGKPIAEAAHDPQVNALRERATVNQIKDFALSHLDDAPSSDEKRRLVVLIGKSHLEGLGKLFDELDITANRHGLATTVVQPLTLSGGFNPPTLTETLKQLEQAVLEEQARGHIGPDPGSEPQ